MDDILILSSPRPSRADAIKNRELLIQTAQRLFSENGVDSVTMSDVAEAAGVGKGTLYRHFSNKTDLCRELIDQDQRDLQDRTLARLRSGGDPLTNLEWFLREVVAFVARNRALAFAESSLGSLLDHPAHLWWRQTVRGLLRAVKPRINIDDAADVFFVMLDPRTIHYQMTSRSYSFEQVAEALVTLLYQIIQ
ncbi:MAG: TetR family transcriptional regulator [Chloroflexota bacterium]